MFLFTDGGSRGNPGNAACACFLFDDKNQLIAFDGEFLNQTTNNVAEYSGLILGLKLAAEEGIKSLTCCLDSELVVKQLNGQYSVKDEGMKKLFAQVQYEKRNFREITFKHVPRAENKFADRLVNLILDQN